ncbi:hypothetical protein Q8F55_002311 [Vanrija albida]|uniref:Uncharacterized protein n=1 Tax=Vanrija albida TaxID=181172 RepID=A0ABR3Q9K2_9TREE
MVKLLLQRKKRGTHGLVISPPLLTSTSTLLLADQDEARRREARRPAPTPEPAPAPAGRPVTPAPRPTMASSKTPTASAQWTPGLFTSEPLEIDDHHNGHNNTRPGPSLNLHYDPPKTPRTPARHVSRTPQTPTRKRSSSSFTSTSGYSPQCFKYKAGEGGVEVALGGLRSSLKGGHYTSDAAVIARTRALAAITGTPPPPLPALPPRSGTANTTTTTTNGRLRQPSAQMVSRWSLSTADDSSSDGDDGDDDDAGETAALFYAGAGRRAGASAGDNTSADTDAHPGSFAASVKSLSLSIKSSKSTAARSMRSFKSVASMGKGVVDLLRRLTPHKKNRRAWFIPAETNNAPMPDLTPGREVISASPDFDETESFRSWSSDPLDPACRTPAPPVHADTNKTRYSDSADMLWPSHSKPAGSTPPMSPAQRSLSPASESSHSRDRSPSGFSLLHRVPTNKTLRKVKSRASKLSFSAPFLHSHANEHHVPEVPPLPQVLSRPATPVSTTPRSVPSSASVVMVPYPFAPQARPAPVRSNASFRGTLSDDDEPLTMDGVLSIVEWGASVSRPSSIGGDTSPGRDSFSLVDIITKEDASDARSFSVQQDTASNKASTLSSSPSAPSKSSIADNNSSVGSFESFEEDDDKEPLPTAVPTFHHPSDPPRSLQDVTMVPPRATETSNPTPTLSDVLRDRTRRLSTPAGWRARSPDTSFGGTPDTPPPPMPPHKAHHTESRKSRLFSLLNRAKTSLDPSAVIDSSLPRMARMQSPAGSERERGEYCRSPTPQNNADDLGIGVPIDPFQSCSSTPTARVSDPVSPEASPYMSLALLPPHLARTTKSYTSLPRCDSDATLDCAPACENKIEPAKGGVYNYARNGSVHTFGQPSLRSLPSVESLTLVDSRSEASDECIEDEERLSGELALEALLESQEVRGARVVAAA